MSERNRMGKRTFKLHTSPVVFGVSASLIAVTLILVLFNLNTFQETVGAVQESFANNAGWFYILTVDLVLGFVIWLSLSRYANIRIGGDNATPEYPFWSWFAMLFSAGMGIGLLFYGVAEPISHFAAPPIGQPETLEAARNAMRITYFHWGLHAWGIYALVSISLAYFAYNKGLPLTIRSAFFPLLGDRIHGWMGHTVDILAVCATLFGVATSLGLGVQQINAGLAHLGWLPQTTTVQIWLIIGITLLATISVVSGVGKGIRRLSETNMVLALILLVFVFVCGPTLFILDAFVQNTGRYLSKLLEMSAWTEAYTGTHWQNSWTIFYWAWWIAWSPFVGMFIARVSKGRTIREMLVGILCAPTLITFLWLTVFGNSALHMELYGPGGMISVVKENLPLALFVLLENYPLASISGTLAVIVLITFFVTSSDSGSYVVDILASGGDPDPPVVQRIFWSFMEGGVAAILLLGGGLAALQTAALLAGLPLAVLLLVLCVSLRKALAEDYAKKRKLIPVTTVSPAIESSATAVAK